MAKTEALLSTGVKITVDSSDIDVKFTKSIDQLNAGLGKSQRALGLQYDAQGRLNDALNRCVEGLSLYKQKLGMWVDDMGRARTMAGGFADGLSRTELELGYYADELGQVKNKSGQFVRLTKEAIESQNEMAEASQRTREAFSDAWKGLSSTISQFSNVITQLDSVDGSISTFGRTVASLSQFVSVGAGTYQSLKDFAKGCEETMKNSQALFASIKKGATASAQTISGLKGSVSSLSPVFTALSGPVGIAVAGVAAVGAGIATAVAASSETRKISDSFKELEKRAKAAGDTIKGVGDALKYGAFTDFSLEISTEFQKVQKAVENAEVALKKARELANASSEATRYAGMSGGGWVAASNAPTQKAEADYKNALAEYNDVVAKMVESAREEQKTEVDRLQEQLDAFKSISEYAAGVDAQSVVQNQINVLSQKIEEAKKREAEQAANDLQRAQQEARKTAGIDRFLEAPKKELELTAEALEKAREDWTKRASDFGLESAQVEEALKNYKTAVDDATRQRLAQKLGVDFGAAAKEELSLAERFKELKKALDDKIIDEKQRDSALAQLQQEQFKELESVADSINAAQNKRKADENYKAALDKINDDLKAQRITDAQNKELIGRVEKEYASTLENLKEKAAQELGVDFGGVLKGDDFDLFETRLRTLNDALNDQTIDSVEYGKALEQLKDKALVALPGMTELQNATKTVSTAEEKQAQYVESLNAALAKGIIDEARKQELEAKADELRKEALDREKEAANAARLSSLGIDAFIAAGEREKTAREKLKEKMDEFVAAESEGIIESTKMTKIRASYRKQLEELSRQEKEAAKLRREQAIRETRSKLGVDSLMEELKTPLEKYRETMRAIESAARTAAITGRERAALENKAADDYWNAMRGFKESAEKSGRGNKVELGKSMSSGSEALYLAQVKNTTANYQSRIQATTENLYKNSQESLYQSQLTNAFLQDIAANAAPAVFG